MEEFYLGWDWARYNVFYFLSYLIPLAFGFLTVFTKDPRGKYIFPLSSVISTFWASGEAITYKWHLGSIVAETPEQKAIVAQYDAANMAFAPLIAAVNAVAFTAICYFQISLSHKVMCRTLNNRQTLRIRDQRLRSKLTDVKELDLPNC